jgi:hypothetical protein
MHSSYHINKHIHIVCVFIWYVIWEKESFINEREVVRVTLTNQLLHFTSSTPSHHITSPNTYTSTPSCHFLLIDGITDWQSKPSTIYSWCHDIYVYEIIIISQCVWLLLSQMMSKGKRKEITFGNSEMELSLKIHHESFQVHFSL